MRRPHAPGLLVTPPWNRLHGLGRRWVNRKCDGTVARGDCSRLHSTFVSSFGHLNKSGVDDKCLPCEKHLQGASNPKPLISTIDGQVWLENETQIALYRLLCTSFFSRYALPSWINEHSRSPRFSCEQVNNATGRSADEVFKSVVALRYVMGPAPFQAGRTRSKTVDVAPKKPFARFRAFSLTAEVRHSTRDCHTTFPCTCATVSEGGIASSCHKRALFALSNAPAYCSLARY
jgi:hypothetical protein